MQRRLLVVAFVSVSVAGFLKGCFHSPTVLKERTKDWPDGALSGMGFEMENMACTWVQGATLVHTLPATKVHVDFETDYGNDRND